MAATTQSELLALTEKEFAKLDKLMSSIPADIALRKDEEDTSIKDVVAHRANWIALFLGWHFDGLAGKTVHFPAEGYKWNELKRYNARLRENQASLSWDEARALLRDRHVQLISFIVERDDESLYSGPMKGANNDWKPGRWAEAAGPSHYRSAGKYIRGRLREMAA
mgnify:FL=1|tara:strand:- start:99 stop:596 length:498 start_codon:yes stop_codon:yes gene_type:complete